MTPPRTETSLCAVPVPAAPYTLQPAVECNPAALPVELRAYAQWVVWKNEPNKEPDKKPVKVLYNPKTGKHARTQDGVGKTYADKPCDTWGTYEQAVSAFQRGGWSGIGFVFTEADPFCGGDIDGCRNPETGELTEEARHVLALVDTYTEVSQSGKGIKFIGKAKKPGTECKRGNVEMYDKDRYFALTGCHLAGTPSTIEARQSKITRLYAEWFPAKPAPAPRPDNTPYTGPLPDNDLLKLAFAAKNGADVERLYRGDWTGYESQSDADLALCSRLAFYAGPDGHAQVDGLFRTSGLLREKWDAQRGAQTYGQKTLDKAFHKTEWYTPGRKPLPEETAALITQEAESGCPLMAPVIARVQWMEAQLRERGVITRFDGIEFPPGIDREDIEAVGGILRGGFDSLTTISNYLWGIWYASLPRGKGHHGAIKAILNRLYADWGEGRDMKVMAEQKRLSELATIVREVIVVWDFTRPWNFYEKLSRLKVVQQHEYAEKTPYRGMIADMERECRPDTISPPNHVSNTVGNNGAITVDLSPALAAAFTEIGNRAERAGLSKEAYFAHLLAHDPLMQQCSEGSQCSEISEKVQSNTTLDDEIVKIKKDVVNAPELRVIEGDGLVEAPDMEEANPFSDELPETALRPFQPLLIAARARAFPCEYLIVDAAARVTTEDLNLFVIRQVNACRNASEVGDMARAQEALRLLRLCDALRE